MKQIKLISLLLLAFAALVVLSCKKNKDTATTKTRTELLTTGTWKYTASVITPAYDYYGDGNAVTDIFSIMKPCEKDDYEIYKADGIWQYKEGATMCDPSDPQEFSDSWRFAANEKKLFVGSVEHTILELTQTTLKLRYTIKEGNITYTEEDTYSH